MRENLRISSDGDSVTLQDSKEEIGRQQYRSGGSGVQKVTGHFGKSIQGCIKDKLAKSGQV